MKADLGYTYESPKEVDSPSKEEPKVQFPSLRIEVTKENEALLKDFPKEGEATIRFRLKRLEIGKEFGPASAVGSVDLEVQSIDVADASIEDTAQQVEATALGQLIDQFDE